MWALVLAAGYSSRFRRFWGLPKQAAPIDGYPLLCYPLTSISLAGGGVRGVVVAVNDSNYSIVREVARSCPYTLDVDFIVVPEPWRGNGYTMAYSLEALGHYTAVVSMSDHIYPPEVVEALVEYQPSFSVLGGDSSPAYIDLDEATKILASNGIAIDIGKGLESYTHVDLGVHLINKSSLPSRCLGPLAELSSLLRCSMRVSRIAVHDFRGIPWIDVDTPEDYEEANMGIGLMVVREVKRQWDL